MSAFTPGPWFVGLDNAEDCPPHTRSGLALVDTGRQEDWPIARLCEWNNVNLIAAAPDLFAALRDLLAAFVNPGDGGEFEDGEVPVVDQARAALSKAEGKP